MARRRGGLVTAPFPDRFIYALQSMRWTTLHVLESLDKVRDISAAGGRWDATYTGSPTLGNAPLPTLPRGVTFSGSGQYATTAGTVPTPSASISVLAVYATSDATAALRVIAGRNAASQFSWDLRFSTSHGLQFVLAQSSATVHCSTTGQAGTNNGVPHLAVGTFDGTTARCGYDAVAAVTSTSLTGSWHTASTAGIGIAHRNAASLWPGTVYVAGYRADGGVITDAERLWLNAMMRGA